MIQNFDFNLFRLLDTLYEERSVTRTAERLFLTPSAVSHALGRLRHLLDDPLFVRGPQGMMPTPRAQEIATRLRILLPQLQDALNPMAFDPRLAERSFTVACLPYLTTLLTPRLAADLEDAAPTARLDVRLLYGGVVDDLDSGNLDVAIGNFRRVPERLAVEDLLRDDSVWVARRDSPIARGRLTLHRLGQVAHVDALVGGALANPVDGYDARQGLERQVVHENLGTTDAAFQEAGLRRNVRFRAPDSLSAMAIAARTGAVALVPSSLATAFAELMGLAVLVPPYRTTPIVMQMLYHRDAADRPAVRWLLDRLRSVVATM